MIYYIVGITEKHDETVLSSWDNADAATRALHGYRETAQMHMIYLDYRIDTVPSNEEARAANARIPADPHKGLSASDIGVKLQDAARKVLEEHRAAKAELNARFAKVKMDHEEGRLYADTDSMRTKEFTIDELFPDAGNGYTTQPCYECGSLVNTNEHAKHVAWHNKLLP